MLDVQQFYLVQNYVKTVIQSHSTESNDTHFDWLLRMIRGIRMTPTREKIELWRSWVVREDLEQRTRGYVGFLWRNKFPMRFFVGGNLFFRVDTSHKKNFGAVYKDPQNGREIWGWATGVYEISNIHVKNVLPLTSLSVSYSF